MKYTAEIEVMPLSALLDPQGKAVENGLQKTGFKTIQSVRIGKCIRLVIEAPNKEIAKKEAEKACETLLANPVMEQFTVRIKEA